MRRAPPLSVTGQAERRNSTGSLGVKAIGDGSALPALVGANPSLELEQVETMAASEKLSSYRTKRDFAKTAQPSGEALIVAASRRRFVIQKHAATRLHYDLRLELDGVLKSWAVTRGPSLDPADKRLAVEVEDHPLDYGDFEGTIPKGEYGGGTLQLWDRGYWEPDAIGHPKRPWPVATSSSCSMANVCMAAGS
jgi:bifunctional non-homologous end joining protein LigD